jgi:hypothetical protein
MGKVQENQEGLKFGLKDIIKNTKALLEASREGDLFRSKCREE